MAQHTFLSDEWLADGQEARRRGRAPARAACPAASQLNMVVTGGPQGDRELHVDERRLRRPASSTAPRPS